MIQEDRGALASVFRAQSQKRPGRYFHPPEVGFNEYHARGGPALPLFHLAPVGLDGHVLIDAELVHAAMRHGRADPGAVVFGPIVNRTAKPMAFGQDLAVLFGSPGDQ